MYHLCICGIAVSNVIIFFLIIYTSTEVNAPTVSLNHQFPKKKKIEKVVL